MLIYLSKLIVKPLYYFLLSAVFCMDMLIMASSSSRSTTSDTTTVNPDKVLANKYDLQEEQIKEFKQAFAVFDKDGDGTITQKELGIVMRSLGQNPSEKEIEKLIYENDQDGNGIIDFEEFTGMMSRRLKEFNYEEEMRETYVVFDKEKKGYISAGDLKHVFLSLGSHIVSRNEVEELMMDLDRNGDGQISYEEFADLITIKPH